ncbi:MAG TPA: YmdB family metallophosphoesterase, partial [Candidatus Babeliales bacterium]|nr:YmdB family metallophosphoesterase [Candidatus Babeliales bacterium]
MPAKLKVLMIGDVAGPLGCAMFTKNISSLRTKYQADAVIVNGENAAENGRGITPKIVADFIAAGASVITTGNHIWAKKEI